VADDDPGRLNQVACASRPCSRWLAERICHAMLISEQGIEDPGARVHVVPERRHEPENAEPDQLDAEQDRDHQQRRPGPGQRDDARDHRDDPERQRPAPGPAKAAEKVGRVRPQRLYH
jgi:hypothetical protein